MAQRALQLKFKGTDLWDNDNIIVLPSTERHQGERKDQGRN
jgi:hypothetical protein